MVLFGSEVLHASDFDILTGKRVGLFTNPAAVDAQMVSTYQRMIAADHVNVVALFGAEHGVFGSVQDGDTVDNMTDPFTGIPVRSLYGTHFKPTAEMLSDIDVMVCDIPDIGVRYYTYQWTMTHIIEACGENDTPVIVLDRPNPLGNTVAGCGLQAGFESLVGRFDVPIQHGLTIGEMMQLFNSQWNPTLADLTVITCQAYQRAMTWQDIARAFVPTSPNMPHLLTVKHYPGACLIEGMNLSEGRGTTLPFEIVGAPFIQSRQLAAELNALDLSDVRFRPHDFVPAARKFAGEACGGVQVHITGDQFDAIATWLHVIHTINALYPDEVDFLPPYSDGGLRPFDRLIGSDLPRKQLKNGASPTEIMAGWENDKQAFRQQCEPYLLYA